MDLPDSDDENSSLLDYSPISQQSELHSVDTADQAATSLDTANQATNNIEAIPDTNPGPETSLQKGREFVLKAIWILHDSANPKQKHLKV